MLNQVATIDEVDAWFEEHLRRSWSSSTALRISRPKADGFRPLERFVKGVVEDRGWRGWLVSANSEVWSFASRIVALSSAFPEVITLEPASIADS